MEKSEFARAAFNSFDRRSILSFDEKKAIQSLLEEVEENLELNQDKILLQRYNFFKIPNAKVEDYKERLFKIQEDREVLAGIRHVGGDVNLPFVHLWANYGLDSYEKLDAVIEEVVPKFKVFNPKYVVLWENPHDDFGKRLNVNEEPSSQVLMGDLKVLKSLPRDKFKHYHTIRLELVKDNSYRKWYDETYDFFEKTEPLLKSWVLRNDPKTMEDSIREGLIFLAKLGDQVVGLISAEKQSLLGRTGCYFTEILLDPKFRGKGYAPSIQRKFIEGLSDSYEVVWGTIDAKNIPSTRTALSVGRKVIRTEYFIPLEGGVRRSFLLNSNKNI